MDQLSNKVAVDDKEGRNHNSVRKEQARKHTVCILGCLDKIKYRQELEAEKSLH